MTEIQKIRPNTKFSTDTHEQYTASINGRGGILLLVIKKSYRKE